jgi:hypothetical protein
MEFTPSALQFLDELFGIVAPLKNELDLHGDDSCCDEIEFEKVFQLCMFDN